MSYPEELVARAKFEAETFGRIGAETGELLLTEVLAWRKRFPSHGYSVFEGGIILKYMDKD